MTHELDRGRATGFRTVSYYTQQLADQAADFDGLPQDCARGQVLAAFKRAAPAMGISPRLRDAIDVLFAFTQDQDWHRGARPIVWPSNQLLQDELALCRRAVQYVLRGLVDAGLVVMVESPSGKRYGKRDADGQIVEAYGIDLSPLATRMADFVARAAAERRRRQERTALRRRATIARKAVIQVAQAGIDAELVGRDWQTFAAEASDVGRDVASTEGLAGLRARVAALEGLRARAERAFKDACEEAQSVDGSVCNAPEGANNCADIQLQTNPQFSKEKPGSKYGTARQEDGRSFGAPPEAFDKRQRCGTIDQVVENLATYKVTPALMAKVFARELDLGGLSDRPGWMDIVNTIYHYRHGLGISEDAWKQACMAMGREGAAVALAIIAARADEIESPGGYLRGMTQRAKAGDLNLGPSVYKIRDLRLK